MFTGESVSWHSSVERREAQLDKRNEKATKNVTYTFHNCTFNVYWCGVSDGMFEGAMKTIVDKATSKVNVEQEKVKPVETLDFSEISDADMLKISESTLTFQTPKVTKKVLNPYKKKA